jgi:D-xylose transport system substrate-binding protein
MKNIAALTLIGSLVIIVAVVVALKFLLPKPPNLQPANLNSNIRIGFALGDLREERWQRDRDLFVEAVEKQGAYVQVTSANSDAETQNSQVENLINQGIQVIVVAPYDGEKMAEIIPIARKANVKIISYDRLIKNSDVNFYISFDNVTVGRMEAEGVTKIKSSGNFAYIGGAPTDNNSKLLKQGAMEVLDPLIKSGSVKIVVDKFMTDWKPDEAYKTIKAYLSSGGTLDAVVAANDGTAGGVIQALKEYQLDGKVPVSGQDAELAACQRVVQGTQALTVYKPIPALAQKAAEIAIAMAKGETPETNNVTNNGKIDVPSYFLDPILVTKENMDATVIKDGFQTKAQVYGLK